MRRLPARLLLASIGFTAGLVLIAVLSMEAMQRAGGLTQALARRQLQALDQTERLDDVLFQKGYVANYLVTHDRHWLMELEERKRATQVWLTQISASASSEEQRALANRLRLTYDTYDATRERTLAAFEGGHTQEALREFEAAHAGMRDVLNVAHALARASRQELIASLAEGEDVFTRARRWLLALTAFTALLGVGFGVWMTRRIARPIYELILQVESAQPERVRLGTRGGGDELTTLTQHVQRLIGELDDQRRRLHQAEKMEALGEISAKLAHEILNPVAGAKVALQAVLRTTASLSPETRSTLHEVDRTLSRIDGILTRLVRYARPLEPRLQLVSVSDLAARAQHAVAHELEARQVRLSTQLLELPLVEVDPGLMVQVLTNLLLNAAQASEAGSEVILEAARREASLVLRVRDHGQGLPQRREKLFRPYFTTREHGNGLGLAVCQNIVTEHGGGIEANDGDGGVGATFTVLLPQRSVEWKSRS